MHEVGDRWWKFCWRNCRTIHSFRQVSFTVVEIVPKRTYSGKDMLELGHGRSQNRAGTGLNKTYSG